MTKSRQCERSGLTLVELLVVLAITVIISALAVPSFVRYARMAGSDPDLARAELFSVLRAAKMYAVSYNTEAAVAYAINVAGDSVDGVATEILDGYVMCRKATAQETLLFNLPPDTFVPVLDDPGRVSTMKDGTCILPDYRGSNDRRISAVTANRDTDPLGVIPILIVDIDASAARGQTEVLLPRILNGTRLDYEVPAGFPAHVFQPSGILRSTASKARLTLDITPTPNRSVEDRYAEVPDGEVDDVTGRDGVLHSERIEIYTTLGRVRLAGTGGMI